MDHRIPASVAAAAVLAVAAAAAGGLGASTVGWPLLFVLLALPIAAGVFYRPFFGVILLAGTIPLEVMLTFGGLGLGRAIGLAVFAAWFLQKLAGRQSWRWVVSGAFFPAAMGFLTLVLASLLWAEHPEPVRSGFIRLAQMVALALIIIDLADSSRKLDLIAKTLVLSALLAAGITLYQYEILGFRRAGGEVAGGINDTAMMLVTVLPLGFYLLRASSSFIWRLLATLYIGISAVSVVTTFSRMNLLLLPPLIAVLYVMAARDRHARGWLLAVAVASAVGATLFVPWDKLGERTETISTYVDQTVRFGREEAATSSRGYHLRIALAIAREQPVLGAGYGNYGYLFREEYQYQVPGRGKVYTSIRSPHSAYLGIAADLGAVGLGSWLVLLSVCAGAGFRARRRARSGGLPGLLPLTESLLIMLGLHVFAYGFYAPHQTDKLLWVVMAMCVAAGRVAATQMASVVTADTRPVAEGELQLSANPAGFGVRIPG
jgi:O-antigen ligase